MQGINSFLPNTKSEDCTIYMRSSKPLTAGIGHDGKNFFFVVKKYYEDFKIAFEALCTKVV